MTRRAAARAILAAALALLGCSEREETLEPEPQGAPEPILEDEPAPEPPAPELEQGSMAARFAAGELSSVRVIGDSITAGWGLPGYDAPSDTGEVAYSGPEGYYEEVSTAVPSWANEFRGWAHAHGTERFVNAGVSGFRMQYLAESPESWLADGADLIVVLLGANDAAKCSEEEFRIFAEDALLAAEAACEKLVVVSPPDNDRLDAQNRYGLSEIDRILSETCATHGWEFVSLIDGISIEEGDLQDDRVHPTEQGSHRLWLAFAERSGLALL